MYYSVDGYFEDDKETLYEGLVFTGWNDFNPENKFELTKEDIHLFGITEAELEFSKTQEVPLFDFIVTNWKKLK